MASFSFNVRFSWKGDKEKGKEMEKIVLKAFTEEIVDEELNKIGSFLEGPGSVKQFGKGSFPRTMELYWEETRADPESGLRPVVSCFTDLDFRLQIVTDDEYQCFTFQNGKQIKEILEDFVSWNKYDKDLLKWLEAENKEVFLFQDALAAFPASFWSDEKFCREAVKANPEAAKYIDEELYQKIN